ncbi:MAG TPA: tetratricopeptide repeat protein [Isosphaeraceae bacterium]|jgi:tetratricopeptide (TPR) repeat protein|nr:tetratricopeptide repeat protein [Isosphaeraceae bacterium]
MPSINLRVFISSPGDVDVERERAGDVLRRLQEEFANFADLEPAYWDDQNVKLVPYLWEHQPMRATAHFQEQIPPPETMDIVVCIFWSRIGTPVQVNGKDYPSGMVYELENAAASFREKGVPDLLVYRKTSPVSVPLGNEAEKKQRLAQLEALEAFVKVWFYKEDGSFKIAFTAFVDADQFEQQLEKHLRALMREKIEARAEGFDREGVVWPSSPFRGLKPFEIEHAPVFYGRAQALNAVRDALIAQVERKCAFLVIFGMSGCGKSSLIRAGLLSALREKSDYVPGTDVWRWCLFRPRDAIKTLFATGDFPTRLLLGLAKKLFEDKALPELAALGIDPDRLARVLRESPQEIDLVLRPALHAVAEAERRRRQTGKPMKARLMVVIDQMEEIFTIEGVEPAQRAAFVAALGALARSGLACVVATMRSDFYPRCAEVPELVTLKEGSGQYDLLPPSFAEIGQMIRYPARDAGLRWGKDPSNPSRRLDDILQEVAWRDPRALPVLEFTLDELFQNRVANRILTVEAYNAIGGLEGALAHRADQAFAKLDPAAQKLLPSLLLTMVTTGEGDQDPVVSRSVALDPLRTDEARSKLLDVLIDEVKILVTDRSADGQAMVSVVHEAILDKWPRLREILASNRVFLRDRTRVANAAKRWEEEGRSPAFLLPEGKPLLDARELLDRRAELEPKIVEFIAASNRHWEGRHRRTRRVVTAVILAFMGFGAFSCYQWLMTRKEKNRAEKNFQRAIQVVGDLAKLGEREQIFVPGSEPLRKELLETARKYYQEFLEQSKDDPALQAEVALADFRVGSITGQSGKKVDAVTALEDGLKVSDGLSSNHQDKDYVLILKAKIYDNLGLLYPDVKRAKDAEPAFDKAGKLWERLARLAPGNRLYQEGKANHFFLLGTYYREESEEMEKAREAFLKAEALWKKLTEQDPTNLEYQYDLAVIQNGLGTILQNAGQFREAGLVYTQASETLETLASQRSDSSNHQFGFAARLKLARSEFNLGVVSHCTGQAERSEAAFSQAVDIWEKLVGFYPLITQYRNDLGYGYINRGILYLDIGKNAQARADFESARKHFVWLAKNQPDDLNQEHGVAKSDYWLARAYEAAGQAERAGKSYSVALKTWTSLLAQSPKKSAASRHISHHLGITHIRLAGLSTGPARMSEADEANKLLLAVTKERSKDLDFRIDLARSLDSLGEALSETGAKAQAEARFKEALKIREQLARESSENLEITLDLGVSHLYLARLAGEGVPGQTSLDHFDRAIAALSRVHKEFPQHVEAARVLREGYRDRAQALGNAGRHQEALADWDRALELAPQQDRAELASYRLRTMARLGDFTHAIPEAETLSKEAASPVLFNLACVYALAVAQAERQPARAGHEAQAARYAMRAMELLTSAGSTGFFKAQPNLEQLKTAKDLEGLRARDDFKRWLDKVASEAGTGKAS